MEKNRVESRIRTSKTAGISVTTVTTRPTASGSKPDTSRLTMPNTLSIFTIPLQKKVCRPT